LFPLDRARAAQVAALQTIRDGLLSAADLAAATAGLDPPCSAVPARLHETMVPIVGRNDVKQRWQSGPERLAG
jgi:hypothetical protein